MCRFTNTTHLYRFFIKASSDINYFVLCFQKSALCSLKYGVGKVQEQMR